MIGLKLPATEFLLVKKQPCYFSARWWWWRKIWEFLAIFNNGFMPGSAVHFARELKWQAYYFVNPCYATSTALSDVFKLQFSCYLMKGQVKWLLNKRVGIKLPRERALMNKICNRGTRMQKKSVKTDIQHWKVSVVV